MSREDKPKICALYPVDAALISRGMAVSCGGHEHVSKREARAMVYGAAEEVAYWLNSRQIVLGEYRKRKKDKRGQADMTPFKKIAIDFYPQEVQGGLVRQETQPRAIRR